MNYLKKNFHQSWYFSALFAFVGVLLLYRSLHDYQRRLHNDSEVVEILITDRALPEGHLFSKEDFKVASILKKYIPIGAVMATDDAKLLKQTLVRPAAEGEMILWSAIGYDLSPPAPSRRIVKGYRALSLLVDEESSIGYLIHAGDRVDLLITVPQKNSAESVTLTLLQNVAVLSTGIENQNGEAYNSVHLMVLPKEAAVIQHAKSKGKISLVLRNPHDRVPGQVLPYIHDQNLSEMAFRQAIQREHDEAIEIIKAPGDKD